MHAHPVRDVPTWRWRLASLAVAGALGASCGSDTSSRSTITSTQATEAAATAPDTTPDTTPITIADTTPETTPATEPATSEPATTAAPAGESLEGDWEVLRQPTSNNGYLAESEGGKLPVQYRRYSVSCASSDCSTLEAVVTLPDGTASDEPLTLAYDGTSLSFDNTSLIACLNAAGTAADGPEVSAQANSARLDGVVEGGEVVSFVGAFSESIITIASDQCSAEDISYDADMVMFRADAATSIAGEGAFTGESDGDFRERLLSECDEDSCLLSQVILAITGDGMARSAQYTWELTGSPADGYTGSLRYTTSCTNGGTGAFVVDPGYDVVHVVTAHLYEVPGAGEPILITDEEQTYTPVAGLTPEQAAQCGPATQTSTLGFGGLATDNPEVVVRDQVVPGGSVTLPNVTLDPAASTSTEGEGAASTEFPGVSFGLVTDAVAYADALGAAAIAGWELKTFGLEAAIASSTVLLTGGPADVAQSVKLSLGGPFDASNGNGIMPYAATDGTTCALRAIVRDAAGGLQLYAIDSTPAECNAYAAFDGYEAGAAVLVQA